ncbi:biotin/lipoyl-containing protein [Pseudogemmobacter sonorensis]|uniref:biotin/lipoyl-containing protein n=1 Tax=Pseudogemmobacter sonorensis TaxID=2989681 RepID=UPI0036A626CF
MVQMSMIEAICDAMDVAMARNERVVVFGQDGGYFVGVFRATVGQQQKYGTPRCFDSPISKQGIVGTAIYVIRMPDIGEGIAEAELLEWMVKPGDKVREDDPLAAVMTDKATVEIPSSVTGRVLSLGGEIGTLIAVGSELIRLEVAGERNLAAGPAQPEAAPVVETVAPAPVAVPVKPAEAPKPAISRPASSGAPRPEGEKPLASPAVRARAREAGIDLRRAHGTGPAGQITHEDLDRYFAGGGASPGPALGRPNTEVTEVKFIGLRRKIAERMSLANRNVPHISSVEEIDVTALEEPRAKLNTDKSRTKLTAPPFLMHC